MAEVKDNLVTEGLSGRLGKRLVFKRTRGGKTLLAVRPILNPDRELHPAQVAQQEAFIKAADYAQGAMTQSLYVDLARGKDVSAYNLAIADWFGKPEIRKIDLNGFSGGSGQTIRISARDDTRVFTVGVVIHNQTGVLEQGQAVPSGTEGVWIYTTTTDVPASPDTVIDVSAQDLPGNLGALSITLN